MKRLIAYLLIFKSVALAQYYNFEVNNQGYDYPATQSPDRLVNFLVLTLMRLQHWMKMSLWK